MKNRYLIKPFSFLPVFVGLLTCSFSLTACADGSRHGRHDGSHGKLWSQEKADHENGLRLPHGHHGGDHDEHEEVLRQRQAADILPFDQILARIEPQIGGEIIETEFEVDNGLPVYEFKYIDDSGRVQELNVNACTGEIIKRETE